MLLYEYNPETGAVRDLKVVDGKLDSIDIRRCWLLHCKEW